MKRIYETGVKEGVTFFYGKEVEKTPAFGLHTLFVVGIHPVEKIKEMLLNTVNEDGIRSSTIEHIFFGANQGFAPTNAEEWGQWEEMIVPLLESGIWCSLDIPLKYVEDFNDGALNEFNNFIPQISIPIPYIKLWNYNTMLKIDDKDFDATNPGVWTHSLHKLMDRDVFTDWSQYKDDKVLK